MVLSQSEFCHNLIFWVFIPRKCPPQKNVHQKCFLSLFFFCKNIFCTANESFSLDAPSVPNPNALLFNSTLRFHTMLEAGWEQSTICSTSTLGTSPGKSWECREWLQTPFLFPKLVNLSQSGREDPWVYTVHWFVWKLNPKSPVQY